MHKLLLFALVAFLFGGQVSFAGVSVAQSASELEKGLTALQEGDYQTARQAFTTASAHGDPMGEYYLGAMFQSGWGGEKSETQALRHYRKAAEKDVPEAQFALGLFYQHGKAFLHKNPDEAISWYTKAAAQGSAAAAYNLGMMYATGEGVAVEYGSNPDYIKARAWFLVTLESMETPEDKEKVNKILKELEGHMTAGQIDRSEKLRSELRSQ